MLKTILGLLLLAGPAHATGYLQGADFATCAQITAAGGVCSQLLNTSAIWDDVDSVVLDTQIAIWNAKQGALTFPTSVINTAGAVTLSGDVTSPGNSFYYGTNGAGTKGWYVLPAPGTGTVTSVSGVAANGFTVGVATATTTPAITIGTSVAAGMVKSSGTGLLAAVAGTDYSSGTSALATGILKNTTGTGALTIAASGTDYQAPISTSAAVTNQFLTGFTAPNTFTRAQPAFTDISGTATAAQLPAPNTSAISASNIDWSALKNIDGLYTKTLSANLTITWSNVAAGQTIVVALTNTASNYTVTWPAAAKWPGGTAPTETIGAHTDVITCKSYDGTNAYCSSVQNF
jgi:hypothetical protein